MGEAELTEIPRSGNRALLFNKQHTLQWTIGTSANTYFSHDFWSSPPYVGWTLYFSPKLIEAVVELVSQFPENYYPQLGYRKVMTFISNQISAGLEASLRKVKPS